MHFWHAFSLQLGKATHMDELQIYERDSPNGRWKVGMSWALAVYLSNPNSIPSSHTYAEQGRVLGGLLFTVFELILQFNLREKSYQGGTHRNPSTFTRRVLHTQSKLSYHLHPVRINIVVYILVIITHWF